MKKAEITFLRFSNSIIALVLTVFGFASSCKGPEPRMMYGVPAANYTIKGKIELSVDNSVLSNIQVKIQQDSVKSDLNGNYLIIKSGFVGSPTYTIQFLDIDGTANGEIAPLDTFVKFDIDETVKVLNVKLKPK